MSLKNNALEIAEKLTLAFTEQDIEAFSQLYADDVIVWHNNDQKEQNKQENIAFIEYIFSMLSNARYDSIVRHVTETGFVQQHVTRGHFVDGSEIPPSPVCMVVAMQDGLISRIDEYAVTAPS